MITLNNKQLCESCFTEMTSEPCPYCGFEKSKYRQDPMTLTIGSTLNQRYMVGGVIGKGGFGITYLAYDLKLDARVAIKEYYPMGLAVRKPGSMQVSVSTVEAGESFRAGAEKFYNEAKMVAKFNGNPNIVSVYDFFYENDTVYFIMGYLQGQTLKSYVKKKRITEGQAVSVFEQISNALSAAHGMNILHRDVSPDNIMLCDDGTIRLLDFGAARQVVAEQSQSLSVILKQGFAPLEQYQKKGKQGPWTDIYALGATIYNALTGDMLSDPMSRLEDDSEFADNRYGISEPLWKVIKKCTMLKIDDRYQDIASLKDDLDWLGIGKEKFTDIEEEISDYLRGRGPEGTSLGGANTPNYAPAADPNATVFLGEQGTGPSSSNETVALSEQETEQLQRSLQQPPQPQVANTHPQGHPQRQRVVVPQKGVHAAPKRRINKARLAALIGGIIGAAALIVGGIFLVRHFVSDKGGDGTDTTEQTATSVNTGDDVSTTDTSAQTGTDDTSDDTSSAQTGSNWWEADQDQWGGLGNMSWYLPSAWNDSYADTMSEWDADSMSLYIYPDTEGNVCFYILRDKMTSNVSADEEDEMFDEFADSFFENCQIDSKEATTVAGMSSKRYEGSYTDDDSGDTFGYITYCVICPDKSYYIFSCTVKGGIEQGATDFVNDFISNVSYGEWFENAGLKITPQGEYKYHTMANDGTNDVSEIEVPGTVIIEETTDGVDDGYKNVIATFFFDITNAKDNGGNEYSAFAAFDRYTGYSFWVDQDYIDSQTDETDLKDGFFRLYDRDAYYDIKAEFDNEGADDYNICSYKITVTCPIWYDGTVFQTGYSDTQLVEKDSEIDYSQLHTMDEFAGYDSNGHEYLYFSKDDV